MEEDGMKTLEQVTMNQGENAIFRMRIDALEGIIAERDRTIARYEVENAKLAAFIEADRNLLKAG